MADGVLLIGLGSHTRYLLQQARGQFWHRPHILRTLMLTPEAETNDEPTAYDDNYALTLTRDDYNALYYKPEVRCWSGPNWHSWGQAIPSNRLHGKLALYHHLLRVQGRIHGLVEQLTTVDRGNVYIYVAAHLHDPFASGALVDLLHLLNNVALGRDARVFGILFLPAPPRTDPIFSACAHSDEDMRLRYATTYAALRELQFITGAHTFYNSHHPDVQPLTPRNSPLQTGDCYLFGGDIDEGKHTLPYDVAVQGAARFIYLHAATPLSHRVVQSPSNEARFTSIGVGQFQPLADQQLYANQEDALIDRILQKLCEDRPAQPLSMSSYTTVPLESTGNSFFQQSRRTLEEARARLGNTLNLTEEDARGQRREDTLLRLETLYTEANTALLSYTFQIEEEMRRRLKDAEETLNPHQKTSLLGAARRQPGVNLTALREMYDTALSELNRARLSSKRQLAEVQRSAIETAEKFRRARVRLQYSLSGGQNAPFTMVLAPAVVLLTGALIWANLWVQAVLWFGGAVLLLPLSVLHYTRNRLQDARKDYVDLQRQMLDIQRQIAQSRVKALYLDGLNDYVSHRLGDHLLRTEQALEQLRDSLDPNTIRQYRANVRLSSAAWAELEPLLVTALWELAIDPDTPIDARTVREELGHHIQQRDLLQRDTYE
ncbi:MAG: hypothetical protein AAF787_21025, partial [Chloroflexota bacterium]